MRPRHEDARERLAVVLGRHAGISARELADALDVSVPTLHRMLGELGDDVVSAGKARRARYALRRTLRGVVADLPIYRIDRDGRAEEIARLAPLAPHGCWMDLAATGWPVPAEARDGWWEGLPYPLYDMRPQGYMGRQFARAEHRWLGVSDKPEQWSDDDILFVLSRVGMDTSGDLIVGEEALRLWQERRLAQPRPIAEDEVGEAYLRLAECAVATGVAGSSAAGEFPKFTALRDLPGSATPHVLVKFSGVADGSPAIARWADLLVCEHLALACVALLPGAASAASRIVRHGGRTFLEVERFDRHGLFGRSALCSLATLNPALLGADFDGWRQLAARSVNAGLLMPGDAQRVECLWWFGQLIGNTDMHAGNLSFRPGPKLELAPVYDMLPMLYAPLPGGETPVREFRPPLPLPAQRSVWRAACEAALEFWRRAAEDGRISEGFRDVCKENGTRLKDAVLHA